MSLEGDCDREMRGLDERLLASMRLRTDARLPAPRRGRVALTLVCDLVEAAVSSVTPLLRVSLCAAAATVLRLGSAGTAFAAGTAADSSAVAAATSSSAATACVLRILRGCAVSKALGRGRSLKREARLAVALC